MDPSGARIPGWGRALLPVLLTLSGCAGEREERPMATLELQSTAFAPQGLIPSRFTCDGEDLSPPLTWSPGPDGTVSYALIAEDPDAPRGPWVHWVAWNLREPRLREGLSPSDALPDGMRQGLNSWKRTGYGGPCPPSGTHRYYFRVWALDRSLELAPRTDAGALRAAMRGHELAEGELMGRYARAR